VTPQPPAPHRNGWSRPDRYVTALAACKGMPEMFFPPEGKDTAKAFAERAFAVCDRCPCRDACLAEALACGPSLAGIWGGTTQQQRRWIISRARRNT
jgi:WhiB family redox-sensing transcriptional regulator